VSTIVHQRTSSLSSLSSSASSSSLSSLPLFYPGSVSNGEWWVKKWNLDNAANSANSNKELYSSGNECQHWFR
jgi:hypothetical protein